MISALVIAALVVWSLVAVALGVVIGMGIRQADRMETKSCCPHPVEEAPATVRGEFRAIVVQRRGPGPDRLDVKA